MLNAQKTPLVTALNSHSRYQIDQTLQFLGKALPASVVTVMGSIVEIKFEITATDNLPWTLANIIVPVAGSEYVRLPLQARCKGVVFPSDAAIGNVTGLGASTSSLAPIGSLSALVFFPVGNKGWTAPEDANQLELYGVDGAILKSTINKEWYVQLTETRAVISNKAGTASIVWNGAAWEVKGPVIFDGVVTMNGNLQLAGSIVAGAGGLYSGDLQTSGNVVALAGSPSTKVTLDAHVHSANNTPPTPGH